MQLGIHCRLNVCRGGRNPTERGAYHDILLCCQTEKCLLRMRDGVRSDVSGAAFNCGVPEEDWPDSQARLCWPRPGYMLSLLFTLAIVLQINIIL